jgi:hypothetical protein
LLIAFPPPPPTPIAFIFAVSFGSINSKDICLVLQLVIKS